MKAIINLTTIAELPCTIAYQTKGHVSFKISRDIATSDTLNALGKMGDVSLYGYSDYVSVTLDTCFVESIIYVD